MAAFGCGTTTKDPAATADNGGMGAGGYGTSGGGAQSGGMAGSGGSAGSAGSGGVLGSGANIVWQPRAGCGKDPGQALGEWQQYLVPLSGETLGAPQTTHTQREIFVRLPADYDNMTAYRVVYIGVGCGSEGTSGYALWDETQGGDPKAIYVGLSPPDPPPELPCYDNRAGLDSIEWESFQNDHAFVTSKFCVDDDKVYIGGYHSGAWLANMYSCYFAGIPEPPRKFLPGVALRGALAVSGCVELANPPCNGPVGGLFIDDENDVVNGFACNAGQRDRLLTQNGCSGGSAGPTEAWDVLGGQCLRYTACPGAYPVVFCTTVNRTKNSQSDIAIPEFTKLIQGMEAAAP